jgi:hypothetical protein
MKVTCLNNPIEGGTLLLPHVIKVDPLHWDHRLGLPHEHSIIPILMKEGPKPLIRASFLGAVVARDLTELHNVGGVHLVVVYHFPICMNFWSPHLQRLILIWSGRNGITWRRASQPLYE